MLRMAMSVAVIFCSLLVPVEASELSYGALKEKLVEGKTTQRDVIKEFGSPDNMVRDPSGEVWIYDKVSNETKVTDEYQGTSNNSGVHATIGILGGGNKSHEANSKRQSTIVRTTKTLTVILEFNKEGILEKYNVRKSKF
jgi:hypothetical protein